MKRSEYLEALQRVFGPENFDPILAHISLPDITRMAAQNLFMRHDCGSPDACKVRIQAKHLAESPGHFVFDPE